MRGYEVVIERHIKPVLGKGEARQAHAGRRACLAAQDERTVNWRTGEVYSGKTITNARRVLHAALQQAVKDGGLGLVRNPADASQGPRVQERETPVFEPDEARRFAASVAGNRLEALYVLALALGLRQGELLGLRWQDADLDGRVLHVRQQLPRSDGRLQLVPLKTRKSRRSLPMPGFVAEQLAAHRERQDVEGLANVMGLVFVNEVGRPIEARNLLWRFKAHVRLAGLADRSFHALRHSAATFLLLQGVEMKVVQEILGHSNLGTTADRYSHLLDRMKREAVDRLKTGCGWLVDSPAGPR